jgi:hypothetical protein
MDLLLIFAGLVSLVIGLVYLRSRILFIKNGIETLATVIKIEVDVNKSDEGDNTTYTPHFKFITHDEKEIIFQHGKSRSWGKWSIGDQIKVFYNVSYPYDIVVGTFGASYGKPIIFLLAAIILIIAGKLGLSNYIVFYYHNNFPTN